MNQKNKTAKIISRKYNGEIHRQWRAELIEESDSLLTFVGEFEDEVSHPLLGVIRRGTVSYEFYWLDRGYNVFRFHEPEGALRNFYCNLNLPPVCADGVLDYVDLDVDVLVNADFSYQVLDLDEFAEHSKLFDYPQQIHSSVAENLRELLNLIERRLFPFNYV